MIKDTFSVKVAGERVSSTLYRPNCSFQKIIIFCHGFWGSNRLLQLAPILTENNIAMAEIGYRGDLGNEGQFSFFGSIHDIDEAYEYLVHRYKWAKITVLGYSAGGLYSMLSLSQNIHHPSGLVLLNPVFDPIVFTQIDKIWEEAKTNLNLYDQEYYLDEISNLQKIVNSENFLSEFNRGETTVVHSENDEIIPHDASKEFFTQVNNSKQTKFITIPNAVHSLRGDEKELVNTLMR